jgi:uncharacterized protein (DUF433 family)
LADTGSNSQIGGIPKGMPSFFGSFFGEMVFLRSMELLERITIEPGKCGGRPCIRGKRIRVTDVLELLAYGASREEILEDYDFLEDDDITAALLYAARQNDHLVLKVAS